MQNSISENINELFFKTFKEDIKEQYRLPLSGSSRMYFRIISAERSIIAAYNEDKKENEAFISLSKTFSENGINVPEIFAEDIENNLYLQEDLGNETLYSKLLTLRVHNEFPTELIELYKKTLEQLADLQVKVKDKINYSVCYPRKAFDRQSVLWDLNYFKYNFLKFAQIAFDEQNLEDDFNVLADFLLSADTHYFLYRDFQSRNIMLHKEKIYFIDYQGGRQGALHYDLASLLYDAKANIPENIREGLKTHYLNYLAKEFHIETADFDKHYYAYVLIRILQAAGAYGYRGLFEKKQHFIDSIPYGLKNLKTVLKKAHFPVKMPELIRVLNELTVTKFFENKLRVSLSSFSYKRGIPYDKTGNGGGFVFDCRFIDNPGRIEKYKHLCGKDQAVINFLESKKETHDFFKSLTEIISSAVLNYQSRNFKNLAIGFGCTGGQHRSVFFAEKTAEYLRNNFDVTVELIHTEGF